MPSRSRSPRRYRVASVSPGRGPPRRNPSRSPMSNRKRHGGDRIAPEPSACLGVFGLSPYTTEKELEKEFGKYGPLESVKVVLDGKSGRSRGFAFIKFNSMEDATQARNALTETEMDGKQIRVDYSVTKRPHTPTPGIYMGNKTALRETAYRSKRTPSPIYRPRRSPSPYYRYRRRTPSPYMRRRTPSPFRGRRMASPYHMRPRRTPSPYRRGGRSPPGPYMRMRSPSPYHMSRRRSPSPYFSRRRSPSPYMRGRSPIPYNRGRISPPPPPYIGGPPPRRYL